CAAATRPARRRSGGGGGCERSRCSSGVGTTAGGTLPAEGRHGRATRYAEQDHLGKAGLTGETVARESRPTGAQRTPSGSIRSSASRQGSSSQPCSATQASSK